MVRSDDHSCRAVINPANWRPYRFFVVDAALGAHITAFGYEAV